MVQDLGEETFPEPTSTEKVAPLASEPQAQTPQTVESQEPPSNDPEVASASTSTTSKEDGETDRKPVTTSERQPMAVPESVQIRITPETLKDYVGPPIYQKDRMYVRAPPPGVSTGLGYLGNGSGAVMPIEAIVCVHFYFICFY